LYQADPALLEDVEGSYPEKEKHESHFYIEPVSSTTLLLYTEFSANFEKRMPEKKSTKRVYVLYPISFHIIICFVKTHFNYLLYYNMFPSTQLTFKYNINAICFDL